MQIVALSNGNQLVWTFSETLGKPVMPDILVLSLPCLNREGSAYYYFLAIHDVNAARKPI